MIFPVDFRPQVKLDVADAHSWYEEQRSGLGADWFLCFEEALDRISRNPEWFAIVKWDVRSAMLHRFPYNVFFRFTHGTVLILGVFHTSRDASHWHSRV